MNTIGLRVALTTRDFNKTVKFFREGIGLEMGDLWTEDDGGQGQLFFSGQSSLEIFNSKYAKFVDEIEVGRQVSSEIRFAFEVSDVKETLNRALKHGGILEQEPKLTPWGDLNARVQSPDGLQITIYQISKPD